MIKNTIFRFMVFSLLFNLRFCFYLVSNLAFFCVFARFYDKCHAKTATFAKKNKQHNILTITFEEDSSSNKDQSINFDNVNIAANANIPITKVVVVQTRNVDLISRSENFVTTQK